MNTLKRCAQAMLFAGLLLTTTIKVKAETILVEAEDSTAGWEVKKLDGASNGKVLFLKARTRETRGAHRPQLSLTIPEAGTYRLWVRYFRDKPIPAGVSVLIRDEAGEELGLCKLDFSPMMPTQQPYQKQVSTAGNRTGFIWESFDMTFERPVSINIEFMAGSTGAQRRREGISDRQIDCILLTTDMKLDPNSQSVAELAKKADKPTGKKPTLPQAPDGLQWATGTPAHVDDFAGVEAGKHRFEAGLINCGSAFHDDARLVRLGFNHDHGYATERSVKHGITTHGYIESYRIGPRQVEKGKYPSPEGRFVNAKGTVGSSFSFQFPPVVEASKKAITEKIKRYLDGPYPGAITAWRTSVEDGGFFDYSQVSINAFRKWLKNKHGDIATLNKRWGTNYTSFDDITPASTFEEGPASWLEHRDFCGKAYAEAVARQMPIVAATDPRKRPCIGANSNLDLLSPYFSALRPIDFDELLNTAYADQPNVSWDTYCADDQIGCETDLMASFAEGRKPIIQEWSNHAVDARLAARSYWTMVGKGVAGIYVFMFQDGGSHATYPKWAMLNSDDRAPKPKLAAYSDAVQEVHRLEPLLTKGKVVHAVKPVALYWSRIDLSLAKPHDSLYGQTLNNPVNVYSALRGQGYPVRWITPRQVRAGQLEDVAAVVLVGCKYIPEDVAAKIETWVRNGGVIIGDELPGARNEYGRPQQTLAKMFGVRVAKPRKKAGKDAQIAVQESTQGYGEVTDAAVVRKEHYTMVDEIAQQPGATHPVAKEMRDFMLSGISPRSMECVAGNVIGMTHRGKAGLVVNDYGKGKALYSSLMLGTTHESGGTGYEWRDTHSGMSFPKLLSAFLHFAGVQKGCEISGLPQAVRAKMRVESPIVTPNGNAVIGITSLNDAPVGPFGLKVSLPKTVRSPLAAVYAATGGSRELQQLKHTFADGVLSVEVPAFDTQATILALRETLPLIGLSLGDVERGAAGLATIGKGQEFTVTATVYNPSTKPLAPGKVSLALPLGWLQDKVSLATKTIPPCGKATYVFKVKAPALAAATRLRPLLARFSNGKVKSTPATEMVWWGTK